MLQFVPKVERREELIRVIKRDVLPILKKQTGFLEILPFMPEVKNEHIVIVSLWNERKDFERYEREVFPKVEEMLQPFLTTPFTWKLYTVETTLCEHFEKAMTV
jgi:heme-degrading monooxygenase HmoA